MKRSLKDVRADLKERPFKSMVGEEDKSTVPKQYDPNAKPLDFWDDDNPRSVINLVSRKIAESARNISPRYMQLADNELRKEARIGVTEDQLRQAFWAEYFHACDVNHSMRIEAVYGQIVSKPTFYELYVNNPAKLAWILRPPKNYTYRMTSLLELGLARIEDILHMDITKNDTRLIAEVVKIVALLDNRVKGAVTQRVQVQTENKHLHAHVQAPPIPQTYNEIEKELQALDREIKQLAAGKKSRVDEVLFGEGNEAGPVIEVENVEAKRGRPPKRAGAGRG
jgi:hypothetical protein